MPEPDRHRSWIGVLAMAGSRDAADGLGRQFREASNRCRGADLDRVAALQAKTLRLEHGARTREPDLCTTISAREWDEPCVALRHRERSEGATGRTDIHHLTPEAIATVARIGTRKP
jgi:hypothetical protein